MIDLKRDDNLQLLYIVNTSPSLHTPHDADKVLGPLPNAL